MQKQNGQILLIVILVIIVASTIGLSLASRSITSLKSSTEEAESQEALAAAEAGIERAIQGKVPIERMDLANDSNYSVEVTKIEDASTFFMNGGNVISKDEGADVWFVDHNVDGDPDYSSMVQFNNYFNLYWGSASEICGTSTAPAAIEAVVVTRDALSPNTIRSYRYAYDGCDRENNFTLADNLGYPLTIKDNSYTFKNRTAPQSNLAGGVNNIVLIRVIPIYKDAVIALSACDHAGGNCTSLPLQGHVITSTGNSGDASHKLQTFEGWSQAYLPYLSYGLFVPSDY